MVFDSGFPLLNQPYVRLIHQQDSERKTVGLHKAQKILRIAEFSLTSSLFACLLVIYLQQICDEAILNFFQQIIGILVIGIKGGARYMRPLAKLHLPVHELAMMMTIALRFIPTLIEETDKIMKAQQARGADFESGRLIARAKAMVPLLVPLFVSAFRRAGELAMAMEARCYHGGEGPTRLRVLRFTAEDAKAFAVTMVALALVIAGRYIL